MNRMKTGKAVGPDNTPVEELEVFRRAGHRLYY